MKSQKIMELETLMPTEMDAGQVFTGTPTGKAVKGYKETCSYTPSVDPRYIFHESARDVVVWFMHDLDPLYLYGPTGCGKTTLIKQLAARLNYPTFEVTGHGRLEFADLYGHISLQKGSMVYEYGPLPLAMRYGGILLINEALKTITYTLTQEYFMDLSADMSTLEALLKKDGLVSEGSISSLRKQVKTNE